LAAVGDPRAEAVFWLRVQANTAPELRAAALQALGGLPPPTGQDKLQRLFDCAASSDFRVAAPAMMILKGIEVNDRTWKDWLPLMDAPDPVVRRFVVGKLKGRDTPELAAALVRQLHQQDQPLHREALACLSEMEHGRNALAKQVLEAKTPQEAWALARAQVPFVRNFPPTLRKKMWKQACAYLETEDRRGDALMFVLREADARQFRDLVEERAAALRKKKQYGAALNYWRILTRDPACGEAVRFEAAACGLKLSSHDLDVDSRASDPCLHQFAALVHRHETDPIVYLKKAKWLDAEDLFYLGFHFAEATGQEQRFGGKVLHWLVSRSPRSKLAKDARRKLRSEGLD
jgi:hypothetical protein